MRGKRTLGRYKLKSYATAEEPREYAVLVTHRDSGDQWMLRFARLRPNVASLDDAERALETLSLAEIEELVLQLPPIPKDLPTVAGPPMSSKS
jgi:hypothetical protein